jgi:hypothetical protein
MEGAAEGVPRTDDGVRDVASLGEITLEGVRRVFPLWRIFPAEGAFWAVRGGWQPWSGPESLLLRALTSTDLTDLAEKLCMQEWLDSLTPEGLAAVWRGVLTRNPR